jgi:hypothetical protein
MAPSWSEQAGPAVKQDLASLLNVAFDITRGTLEGGVASRHFMVVMDLEGSLSGRMAYSPDAIDTLIESAIDDESRLRAVLVVPDCGDEQDPVLRGYGDHREGPAFDVTIAWQRRPDSPLLDIVGSQISPSSWWLFE